MSDKKTLVGKALQWIVEQFKANKDDFFKFIWKKVNDELKVELSDIIEIVERIKSYVDHPGVDLLTFAIPGSKDDKAVAFMRSLLGDIISYLNLLDKPTSEYTPTDNHNIATLLAEKKLGLTYGQAAVTIENAYQNLVKNV